VTAGKEVLENNKQQVFQLYKEALWYILSPLVVSQVKTQPFVFVELVSLMLCRTHHHFGWCSLVWEFKQYVQIKLNLSVF
jgi:hypothetical protein